MSSKVPPRVTLGISITVPPKNPPWIPTASLTSPQCNSRHGPCARFSASQGSTSADLSMTPTGTVSNFSSHPIFQGLAQLPSFRKQSPGKTETRTFLETFRIYHLVKLQSLSEFIINLTFTEHFWARARDSSTRKAEALPSKIRWWRASV